MAAIIAGAMKVRKAVIPTAGFGTRFLPATRSVPKVLIPVLDRPAIHYSVNEAARAGIQQIVLVISHGQEGVGDYFDPMPELEQALERRGNSVVLEQMHEISTMAEVSYVYQDQPLGLGHAVLCARNVVDSEPFAVLLPDDLIWSDVPTIGTMVEIFDEYQSSVIAAKEVPDHDVPNVGIIDPKPGDGTLSQVAGLVEKPARENAKSNLAIIGRYVLTPEVFGMLERVRPGALGEIQLTDAIAMLLSIQDVYAHRFSGAHFDIGTPLGLLKASVYVALHREDISTDFRDWLATAL